VDGGAPLTASSAARAVVVVRGFHRFLLLEGLAPTDPAQQVRPPQSPKRLPKAIPVAEVERVLEAASFGGAPGAIRDRAMLEVLYGCGARISEAVGLDVDDLVLGSGADGGSGADDGLVRLRKR
jgi:integrase/recombinase XerD